MSAQQIDNVASAHMVTSVAPSLLADLLHNHSHAVAGVVAFAVFGAAAAAQLIFGRAGRRAQVALGLAVFLAAVIVAVTRRVAG